ncbi:MAG: hypothetical protein WA906_13525 [Pacificimonas sp.]
MFTALRLFLIGILVASSVATAADAHRYHRHHKHRGGGFDLGDAIIGAAVLGGIIAVANSAKNKRDEREGEPVPPAPYPEPDYDVDGVDDRPVYGAGPAGDWGAADPDYDRRFPSERAAVDACAREAEALGGRYGADARLIRIDRVARGGEDYEVAGAVDIADNRSERRETAAFTCFAGDGVVTGFRFQGAA